MFPQFGNARRLLLASHGRLIWYRYDRDEAEVLHEGEVRQRVPAAMLHMAWALVPLPQHLYTWLPAWQGIYHAAFPGDDRDLLAAPASLWVLSRHRNDDNGSADGSAPTKQEWLLHLGMESGDEHGRVALPTR